MKAHDVRSFHPGQCPDPAPLAPSRFVWVKIRGRSAREQSSVHVNSGGERNRRRQTWRHLRAWERTLLSSTLATTTTALRPADARPTPLPRAERPAAGPPRRPPPRRGGVGSPTIPLPAGVAALPPPGLAQGWLPYLPRCWPRCAIEADRRRCPVAGARVRVRVRTQLGIGLGLALELRTD